MNDPHLVYFPLKLRSQMIPEDYHFYFQNFTCDSDNTLFNAGITSQHDKFIIFDLLPECVCAFEIIENIFTIKIIASRVSKMGYGSLMINHIKSYCQNHNIHCIIADTVYDAKNFYFKHDFYDVTSYQGNGSLFQCNLNF